MPLPEHTAHPISVHSTGAELIAAALGGAIGGSLRHAVYRLTPIPSLEFAWNAAFETLAINLVGALFLGLLYGHLSARGGHSLLRPFLGIGILGSFTTYSTLVLESSGIAGESGPESALALVLTSLVLGITAYELGHRLASGANPSEIR